MTQRLRLFTGLVLFTYVITHLLNHALGVISLDAAAAGRVWFTGFWRFPLFTALLYASLITHIVLALWALYRRRHLRLPRWEIVRLVLGLCIPLLLFQHIFGTRIPHEVFGIDDTYDRQMLIYGVLNPVYGLQQLTLLTIAWTHGWLGVYQWTRLKPRHGQTVPVLQALALALPLLAIAGFVSMSREVSELAEVPGWAQRTLMVPASEVNAVLDPWKLGTIGVFVAGVALTFIARQARTVWQRRAGVVRVTYPDGRRVAVVPGTTVLEASRAAGIPHASLCGGRGRCSTCRTRIGAGLDQLPAPSADEARVLKRISAPPNVRLACQVRPTSDLEVFPLLPPVAGLPDDLLHPGYTGGAERELAILFADMRAFTRLAETRLPYDVVFILNQYSAAMGHAIERAGGRPNQFVGDGIMALFGLNSEPQQACREALRGALNMARALQNINHVLAHDLQQPLRIGIGIHMGHVIVGEMGYGLARYLTAIGDVVNTTSRLEELTKEYDSQVVVSEDVASRAELDLSAYPKAEIEVRGRSRPITIRVIPSALDLERLLPVEGAVI
jgi:adenylate cyclase